MKKRIIISAIALPLLFFIIRFDFFYSSIFFIFVISISMLSAGELFSILKNIFNHMIEEKNRTVLLLILGLFFILHYIFLNVFNLVFKQIGFIIFFSVVILIIFYSLLKKDHKLLIFFLFVFSIVYTGYFPLFIYLIRRMEFGYDHIYILFSLCWLSDAASYFIGKFIGKKKGIIKWSPNKTLEGFIGGYVLTLLSFLWIKPLFWKLNLRFLDAFLISSMTGFLAPIGDIFESWLKRKAGMKDSSRLLPQMGGVLDIFDSILLTSPLYYIMINWVLKIG